MSHPDRYLNRLEFPYTFSSTVELLRMAISKIGKNGVVRIFNEEGATWHEWKPKEPVNVYDLPPDRFAYELLEVAEWICSTFSIIRQRQEFPSGQETQLRLIALFLTAYRFQPEFLVYAASLTHVETDGFIYHPHLPPGSCWEWVPKIKQDLFEHKDKYLIQL